MGKIGIAPHQQTLNLYYFNKYINFVIKLVSSRIQKLLSPRKKEKEDKS
jgi:hypothetical protein